MVRIMVRARVSVLSKCESAVVGVGGRVCVFVCVCVRVRVHVHVMAKVRG
jgi:hypothetical protein